MSKSETDCQKHDLITAAGHTIVAQVFNSQQPESKGVCIIATATGVAQYLYNDFAVWLSEQGYTTVTFDYDGIGLSIDRHVKYSQCDKLSWALYDCPAILDFVEANYPGQKRTWIGHSVGGHLLGMMNKRDSDRLDHAITVGSGTGTWWHNAAPTKRVAWALWYFIVPVVVPILGYFPGDKLKIMCDLPKGVIYQWRRWCLKKDYAIGYEGDWLRLQFANVKLPITAFAFTDDEMMSLKNVKRLHAFFTSAKQSLTIIKPADIEQKRIGHIGWHRKRYKSFWEKYLLPALEG